MSKLVHENDIKDENWLTLSYGDESKVVEQPDAHWNSASQFMLYKEDYTVANLLRMKLHTNKLVRFAGYKVPHPTLHEVEFTVQTAPINSGTSANAQAQQSAAGPVPTPGEAMLQAVNEVLTELDTFANLWEQNVMSKQTTTSSSQLPSSQ